MSGPPGGRPTYERDAENVLAEETRCERPRRSRHSAGRPRPQRLRHAQKYVDQQIASVNTHINQVDSRVSAAAQAAQQAPMQPTQAAQSAGQRADAANQAAQAAGDRRPYCEPEDRSVERTR